jgi:hypothetical protein
MAAKDKSTDKFPKVGDDEAQVVNVSGDPSPNTKPVPRPRTVSATPPGGPTSRRSPVEIDATTGQAFGEATAARARQVWAGAVDRHVCPGCDPVQHQFLGNLLGLDSDYPHDQA